MARKIACLLLGVSFGMAMAGCQSGSHADTPSPSPAEKIPVIESVPEITDTVDTIRARHNNLTEYWTVNENPILYNFVNLYNCEVVKTEDDEYPYRMYIFGETTAEDSNPDKGYDSIYHARGKSLTEWEVWCGDDAWDTTMMPSLWKPVLRRAETNYDSVHNGDPSVVYKDGTYYMAFSAVGFDNRDGVTYIINNSMGATSDNGVHWTKSSAPILIWEKEYEEGWVAGEASPPSTGGYHRPSIIWDEEENKWKMWFDYYLPGTFLSMGYAVNNGDFMDPDDWQLIHAEQTPQLKDWPNPEVVKINGKYYAFSDAPNFGTSLGPQNDRQIVMAVSDNGWDWRVVGRMLPEDKTYGTHLPQPFVQEENGELFLYVLYSMVIEEDLPKYSMANFMKISVSQLESITSLAE